MHEVSFELSSIFRLVDGTIIFIKLNEMAGDAWPNVTCLFWSSVIDITSVTQNARDIFINVCSIEAVFYRRASNIASSSIS